MRREERISGDEEGLYARRYGVTSRHSERFRERTKITSLEDVRVFSDGGHSDRFFNSFKSSRSEVPDSVATCEQTNHVTRRRQRERVPRGGHSGRFSNPNPFIRKCQVPFEQTNQCTRRSHRERVQVL